MIEDTSEALTEDELDRLVSVAIRRAEMLDDANDPDSANAWREVMNYEEQLAAITLASEVPGGVARVGAVRAALAAGLCDEAHRLASKYLAEDALSEERRAALTQALEEGRKAHEHGNSAPRRAAEPWRPKAIDEALTKTS